MKLISFEHPTQPLQQEEKYQYWKHHLLNQRRNGLTLRQYSEIHQLSFGSLKYWSSKIRSEKSKLIPIQIKSESSHHHRLLSPVGLCTLILNDKYTFHIHDKETLFHIFEKLES